MDGGGTHKAPPLAEVKLAVDGILGEGGSVFFKVASAGRSDEWPHTQRCVGRTDLSLWVIWVKEDTKLGRK